MPNSSGFFSARQPEQNKPKQTKNFFQNYYAHLEHLNREAERIGFVYQAARDKAPVVIHESLGRLNMFDPLRDGYDYFDEVMGATFLPGFALTASVGLLAKSIWESVSALAMECRLIKNDDKAHWSSAGSALVGAALAFVFAAVSFMKSVLSMLTRPLITAVQGFKPQDTVRFYNMDDAPSKEKGLLDNVVDLSEELSQGFCPS